MQDNELEWICFVKPDFQKSCPLIEDRLEELWLKDLTRRWSPPTTLDGFKVSKNIKPQVYATRRCVV